MLGGGRRVDRRFEATIYIPYVCTENILPFFANSHHHHHLTLSVGSKDAHPHNTTTKPTLSKGPTQRTKTHTSPIFPIIIIIIYLSLSTPTPKQQNKTKTTKKKKKKKATL
jgi:hypothetical protein